MPSTRITSREFNQHVSRAKRDCHAGPVIITNRGQPAYVLMTIGHYLNMSGADRNIVELLSMPEGGEVAFDHPRLSDVILHPPATME